MPERKLRVVAVRSARACWFAAARVRVAIVRAPGGRRAAGGLVSLAWHLALLWALTIPFAAELYGAPGPDFGSGMAVSVVDGDALENALQTARARKGPRSEQFEVTDIVLDDAIAPRPMSDVNPLHMPIKASTAAEAGSDGDQSSDEQLRDAT